MCALIHPQSFHLFHFSRLKPHCKHIVFNGIVLHIYLSLSLSLWRRSLGKWAWRGASAVTSAGAVQIAVVLKRPLSSALSPLAARSSLSLAASVHPSIGNVGFHLRKRRKCALVTAGERRERKSPETHRERSARRPEPMWQRSP